MFPINCVGGISGFAESRINLVQASTGSLLQHSLPNQNSENFKITAILIFSSFLLPLLNRLFRVLPEAFSHWQFGHFRANAPIKESKSQIVYEGLELTLLRRKSSKDMSLCQINVADHILCSTLAAQNCTILAIRCNLDKV